MSDFDQRARDWDKNKMHGERTNAVAGQLEKMVRLRPDMKAMEFGAGTGLLSFHLKERFSQITLVDTSQEMLKAAEAKMEAGDLAKFRTLQLNLETEEYRGDPFDIIYSQMVLHHVNDIQAMVKKFYSLLSPGGVLAIADLYSEDGSFHDGAADVHHGFDPENLEKILWNQGFQSCKVVPCFVITKEITPGNFREYPVFLMSAVKENQ